MFYESLGKELRSARIAAGFTQTEAAARLNVTNQNISSWELGKSKIDMNQLLVLCEMYNIDFRSIISAASSSSDIQGATKPEEFSAAERQLIKKYRVLDAHGKRMIDYALDEETARMAEAESKKAPATKTIPLFGSSFAAGFGEPDFGNAWENYEVEASSTADFAIRINGDSMEPYLPDGSIALGVQRLPADGEVAALLVDGNFLVKQICQDILGNLYLFALNRHRKDTDLEIKSDSGRSVQCFGTIPLKNLPQLPVAIGG